MTIKEAHVSKRSAVFNLPNILTYGRILAVAALVGTFFMKGDVGHWTALAIFAVAGITDFFDGYLARVMEQQS